MAVPAVSLPLLEQEGLPEFAGLGAQYNQNVFAPVSREAGVTDEYLGALRRRLGTLRPQLVRIFFAGDAFKDPDLMTSFRRTVKLAQNTSAAINITYQGVGRNADPVSLMHRFGEVLEDLVTTDKISKLTWVTVRNEPNRPQMEKELYFDLYQALDRELIERGVRSQIRFMGGDLLINKQQEWFSYLAENMAEVLDAYSIHVYWDYWNPKKIANRLNGVRKIWDRLAEDGRKPLYVTEFGVRGVRGDQKKANPGFFEEAGTLRPLSGTKINAFQHAWFALLAAKLGYHALVKWDAYSGRYGTGKPAKTMAFELIGAPAGPHPSPTYELMRLLAVAVSPGARVFEFKGAPAGRLIVGFAGPNHRLAVLGLDTAGGLPENLSLNTESSYTLSKLPPDTAFQLRYWNRNGDGRTTLRGRVHTNAEGSLPPIKAPLQSVFALTSVGSP